VLEGGLISVEEVRRGIRERQNAEEAIEVEKNTREKAKNAKEVLKTGE
jgi:hypothetical protein